MCGFVSQSKTVSSVCLCLTLSVPVAALRVLLVVLVSGRVLLTAGAGPPVVKDFRSISKGIDYEPYDGTSRPVAPSSRHHNHKITIINIIDPLGRATTH